MVELDLAIYQISLILLAFWKARFHGRICDRHLVSKLPIRCPRLVVGVWDPFNVESLIRYSAEKGYPAHGWALGNELCGSGVGTTVAATQYASDLSSLNHRLKGIYYKDSEYKLLMIAPGGFFDTNWFLEFLSKAQNNNLDVITHHIFTILDQVWMYDITVHYASSEDDIEKCVLGTKMTIEQMNEVRELWSLYCGENV